MRRRIVLVAIALLASAGCAVRPAGPPAPSGPRLRITHCYCASAQGCDSPTEARHEGELIFASFDSVVIYSLRDRREFAVPAAEISRLEVYRGRRGSAEAALEGAAKGALLGAAAGAVLGVSNAVMESILGSSEDAEKEIAAGAAGGAVIGAAAGVVEGATKGDAVWQEITIRRLLQDLCRCQDP
jgi:hypothetical protein